MGQTGPVSGYRGQKSIDQLLLIAEGRPQPGGHFVHDSAQPRGGSAPPVAATGVFLEPDDECPHAATIDARSSTWLKVVLRPPGRRARECNRNDIEFAHATRVRHVATACFAVAAEPELSSDERQPGVLVVGLTLEQLP